MTSELRELENRLRNLEAKFSEVEKLKGIPGQEGRPGNIQAALDNCEKRFNELVEDFHKEIADTRTYVSDLIRRLHADMDVEIRQLHADMDAYRADLLAEVRRSEINSGTYLETNVKNILDAQILDVLESYHLLKDGAPTLAADVTAPKVTAGKS